MKALVSPRRASMLFCAILAVQSCVNAVKAEALQGAVGRSAQSKPTLVVEAGHTGLVSTVAFSPDGKLLAWASRDKTIALWDVSTGQQIRTIAGLGEQPVVAFSPNGLDIASSGQNNT